MAQFIAGAAAQIPNIFGGFAPFPNTIATALLAYQSEAIGYGFGIKFQYAKRQIGAMSNEEFNALTELTLGNLVEQHNTELINRMRLEMPKWLDIQRDFIEASVEVEIAKAERTPSAWAEIIQAFSGAAGQQIADSLNQLDPAALGALLAANPILALIYSFANTSGGTTPPDEVIDDSTPPSEIPDALPPHIDDDEIPFHSEEEHAADLILQDQKLLKIIRVVFHDPVANFTKEFTTLEQSHFHHHALYTQINNGTTEQVKQLIGLDGINGSTKQNLLAAYIKRINIVYLH